MKKLILIVAVLAFLAPAFSALAQTTEPFTYKYHEMTTTDSEKVCCYCQLDTREIRAVSCIKEAANSPFFNVRVGVMVETRASLYSQCNIDLDLCVFKYEDSR